MWKRWAGSIFATALMLGWGSSARAERPRIAVEPVAGEHASAELRARVGQSLAEGLIASGADVAPAPSLATYTLRGRMEVEGRSYTLRLEILDRRTGSVVASREDRCEICTETEAFETASTAASTLKALVFKRQASVVAVGEPAPPSPPRAADPGLAPVRLEATATPAPKSHRGAGWAGLAGGIVAAGAGVFLISVDGHGTCDGPGECPDLHQTRWPGIGLTTLGAAAIVAGVMAITGRL